MLILNLVVVIVLLSLIGGKIMRRLFEQSRFIGYFAAHISMHFEN